MLVYCVYTHSPLPTYNSCVISVSTVILFSPLNSKQMEEIH